ELQRRGAVVATPADQRRHGDSGLIDAAGRLCPSRRQARLPRRGGGALEGGGGRRRLRQPHCVEEALDVRVADRAEVEGLRERVDADRLERGLATRLLAFDCLVEDA